jgi:hypothetical protein
VTTVLLAAQLLAHLGALHTYEKALVLVLAFGPFLVLGVVVVVMRRRDIAAELQDGQEGQEESASHDAPT